MNQASPSSHGGSLKITLTVLLNVNVKLTVTVLKFEPQCFLLVLLFLGNRSYIQCAHRHSGSNKQTNKNINPNFADFSFFWLKIKMQISNLIDLS